MAKVGNMTGGPEYVYVAAYGGGIAAQAALSEVTGEDAIPTYSRAIPWVTFTDPQVVRSGSPGRKLEPQA